METSRMETDGRTRMRFKRAFDALALGGLCALVALPVLRVGIGAVRNRAVWWTPDLLETLLSTVSAAHGDQLLGPWSRIGINHLGPVWFYVAAPFVRLTHGHPAGLVLAASALAAASLAVTVVVVHRSSGMDAAAVAAATLAVGVMQLTTIGLAAPWNPTILIAPTTSAIVCLADVVRRGSPWSTLGATTCGTIVAQSHLSAAPLGLAIAAAAVAAFIVHRVSGRTRTPVAAIALLAAATALPWVPVLLDELVGTGNAATVVEYSVAGTIHGQAADHPLGISRDLGLEASVRELTGITALVEPRGALWAGVDLDAGGAHHTSRRSVVAFVALVASAAAIGRPRRRGSPPTPLAAWIARAGLGALLLEAVATVRLRHEFRPYLLASSAGVGLALWLAVALTALEIIERRVRRSGPRLGSAVRPSLAALAVAAALVTLPGLDRGVPGGVPLPLQPTSIDRLVEATGGGPIRFRNDGPWPITMSTLTLVLELDHRGIPVSVRGSLDEHYGDRWRRSPWVGRTVVVRMRDADALPGCVDVTDYRDVTLCLPT